MDNFMKERGEQLRAHGYAVIPIAHGAKSPGEWDGQRWRGLRKWTTTHATPELVAEWSAWPGCGVGILCGPQADGTGVIAVDLDVDDPELLAELEQLAGKFLATTKEDAGVDPPRRVGAPGRALLVYRIAGEVRGTRVGGRQGVEILGRGRQFVAYHEHPTTLKPYEWTHWPLHESPLSDLPTMTQDELTEYLDAVAECMGVDPPAKAAALRVTSDHPKPVPEAVQSAAAALRNDDLDYDSWVHRGLVLRAAFHESGLPDTEGEQAWLDFSRRAGKNDETETAKKWRTFQPNAVTASSLFVLAKKDGWAYIGPWNVEKQGALEHGEQLATALLEGERVKQLERAKQVARDNRTELTDDLIVDTLRGHVTQTCPAPPPELFEVGGFLGAMTKWITDSAPKPQPWLALGSAITTVATLTGRRYATPTGLRGNIMSLGVAPSGAGKEHPRAAGKELLFAANLAPYVGGARLASEQGLLSALQQHAARLYAFDEFGEVLSALLSPRASSFQRGIVTTMTELFTSAAGTYEGTDYANSSEKPREPLAQPHLCVFAVSAGAPLWDALQTGQAASGFLARWLLFVSDENPEFAVRPGVGLLEPPADLVSSAVDMTLGMEGHDYRGPCNPETGEPWPNEDQSLILAAMGGEGRPVVPRVPWGPGGAEAMAEVEKRVRWLLAECRSPAASAVVARHGELVMKVALARAVGDNAERPAIGAAEVAWARTLVEHCQASTLIALERFVGASRIDSDRKHVLDAIRRELRGEGGARGLPRSALTRRTQKLGKRVRDEVLAELIETGQVLSLSRDTGGKRQQTILFAAEHSDAWATLVAEAGEEALEA